MRMASSVPVLSFWVSKRDGEAEKNKQLTRSMHHVAGLAAGTTEAVLVVSPMDLIKIRLQVCLYINRQTLIWICLHKACYTLGAAPFHG